MPLYFKLTEHFECPKKRRDFDFSLKSPKMTRRTTANSGRVCLCLQCFDRIYLLFTACRASRTHDMSGQRTPSKPERRHRKSMSASDAQIGFATDSEVLPSSRNHNAEAGPSVPRSRHSRHPILSDAGSLSEVETMRHVPRTPRSSSRRALSGEGRTREREKGKGKATLSDVQGWVIQVCRFLNGKHCANSSALGLRS